MKAVIVITILFLSSISHAVQMKPDACVVDKLVDDAKFAFCGVCTNVEPVVKPSSETLGAGSTSYTFKVNEDIIGNIGKDTITFKQTGTPNVTRWLVNFEPNKEYCILLSCNDESGFCAPTGLSCGRFAVRTDADGKKRIHGALRTQHTFRGVVERSPALSKELSTSEREAISRDTALEYSDFISIVKKIRNQRSR